MPTYIIKADPDEDFYVMWSTVVDAPGRWGTRAEVERSAFDPREVAPERFDRADTNGTSAAWKDTAPEDLPYHWTDEGWMVREVIPHPDGGTWVLPRRNLRAFCEALNAEGVDPTSLLTLEPYEDDDEAAQ